MYKIENNDRSILILNQSPLSDTYVTALFVLSEILMLVFIWLNFLLPINV